LEIVSFEPDAPGPGEGDNDNDGHGTHVAGKFDWFLPYCSFMTFAFLIAYFIFQELLVDWQWIATKQLNFSQGF
jgi:hypothetical protein